MPTYEYQCDKCGYTFEVFQRISAEPIKTCPKCGGHVRRLIGGGMGIIFKGSGFYTTDYKQSKSNFGGNGKGGNEKEASGDNGSNGKGKVDKSSEGKEEKKVDASNKKS